MPRVRAPELLRSALLAPLLAGAANCAYLFPSCATIPGCPPGQDLCNNLTCADLTTDPLNCGFCNNACGAGLVCQPTGEPADGGSGGACGCPIPGQVLAHGQCIDLQVDPEDCGTIGNVCRPDQACLDGGCGCIVPPYLAQLFDGGVVPPFLAPLLDGGSECATDAGMVCTDLLNDPSNCGACGRVCSGACTLAECDDGGLADAGGPGPSDGGDGGPGTTDGGDGGPGTTDGGDGG
jgi:hypothetical protein